MIIIKNATIIDGGKREKRDVAIGDNGRFWSLEEARQVCENAQIIDAEGLWLLPGVIDTHVHFRDPGLIRKGDMATESRQAVMGGVTSYLDMPNTLPQTTTIEAWEEKMRRAAEVSAANYGFFIGATSHNMDQLEGADYCRIPGIKLFMGASTGDMAVHQDSVLEQALALRRCPVVVHAEDDKVLACSREQIVRNFSGEIPINLHPRLRPAEACVRATERALRAAEITGGRLHIAHLSTAREVQMIAGRTNVSADTCPQYLIFSDQDYDGLGSRIKCNPAIKSAADREALRQAVVDGVIEVIDTDHAPHLLSDKQGDALTASSGMPGVRFALQLMLSQSWLSPETVVERMCNAPARIYNIKDRGRILPGYFADLVLANPQKSELISDSQVVSPCHWTPYNGIEVTCTVQMTMVNGQIVYQKDSKREIPALGQGLVFG